MTQSGSVALPLPVAIQSIVAKFSPRPEVKAIALGGSRRSGFADAESDFDIYVFVDYEIALPIRRELAVRFDPTPEINNTWWGPGDEWADQTSGTAVDLVYFESAPFLHQLRGVIERHQPSRGYSTSFWFTVAHANPLFDRHGWFAEAQRLAASPYPEQLRRAIVRFNHPLLRSTRSCYRHQIELACNRIDPVGVQNRTSEMLVSVFDIVFAINRTLHPGEKRQLAHVASLGTAVPSDFDKLVRTLIRSTADPDPITVIKNVDALCDVVDSMIETAGLEHEALLT